MSFNWDFDDSKTSLRNVSSWSRHYARAMEEEDNNETSPPTIPVIFEQPAVTVDQVKSSDSVGSQTLPWTPSDEDAGLSKDPFLLESPDHDEHTHQSLAKTWSWRVNRHDTRISPDTAELEDEPEVMGWDELSKSTSPAIEEKGPKQSRFTKKKKAQQRKRRESIGTNLRGRLGFCNLVVHDLRVWWGRYKRVRWEMPIFRKAINTTESHFGSSVVSLFIFTKWIFCLNLLLAVIWFFFVIFPNILFFPYGNIQKTFRLHNLLDGKGMLGESWMFYGHYPKTVSTYHLDFAYLIAILLTYFGSFFIILRGIAEAQSHSELETHTTRHKFSSMLLTSWDYSITSREAVHQCRRGIINAFQDLMVEAKAHAAILLRSRSQRVKVKLLRALAWFLTIVLIGGACTGIIMLVVYVNFADVKHSGQNITGPVEEPTGFFSVYGTTIIFSLINIFVPLVIARLPLIEHYSTGKTELIITLTRVFFLRMANLVALLFSLYDTIQHVVDDQSDQGNSQNAFGCVGTVIGQELYKLVVMDTLVHTVVNICMYFGRYYWMQNKLELHLPSAILVIIYRQALIWVGTLACPVMPLVGLASVSVFFGVNFLIVHKTCNPPVKRWNQSRHSTFFLHFLLFSLMILIPPVSFLVGSNHLALGKAAANVPNGPFGLNQPTAAFSSFRNDLPDWLKETIDYVLSDVVLLPVFLILISLVLYLRLLVGHTERQTVYLKADLRQEREDNKGMAKRLRFLQHMELTNKARNKPKVHFR